MINRVRESNKKPGARVMSVWIQHDNADGTYGVNHDGCVKPSPIYFICGIHPARGWEVEPGDIHSFFFDVSWQYHLCGYFRGTY